MLRLMCLYYWFMVALFVGGFGGSCFLLASATSPMASPSLQKPTLVSATTDAMQLRHDALQACCDPLHPPQWSQAYELGNKLVALGDKAGYYVLAQVYGTPKQLYFDAFKALLCVKKAIQLGSSSAKFLYGQWLYEGDTLGQQLTPTDLTQAMQLIEEAANEGCVEAQLFLADYYSAFTSDADEMPLETVAYWFTLASQQDAHWRGELVALADYALQQLKQPQQALTLYEKAQALGEPHMYERIAELYADGVFGVKQRPQALAYYEKAAQESPTNTLLQEQLGNWFVQGAFGVSNVQKGRYWLQQAAEQGAPTAMWALATLYEKQLNDPLQALTWYETYVDQRPSGGLYYRLAYWWEHGKPPESSAPTARSIRMDVSKSLLLYEKASALGDLKATRKLGFYYKTTHTPEMLERACHYFELATKQGDTLSATHLQEAKQLLAACPLFPASLSQSAETAMATAPPVGSTDKEASLWRLPSSTTASSSSVPLPAKSSTATQKPKTVAVKKVVSSSVKPATKPTASKAGKPQLPLKK
ncbi:MAG: tetratricopeptide repeat protein [Vampirovibrionales bacterium]